MINLFKCFGKEKRALRKRVNDLEKAADYYPRLFKEALGKPKTRPFVRFILVDTPYHFYEPIETFKELDLYIVITLHHSYLEKESGEYMIVKYGAYQDNVLTYFITENIV